MSRDDQDISTKGEALRWTADRRFLLLVALCYLPLLWLGYGGDSDTYATLDMGRHLRDTGHYVPSRDPGYPIFELVMAVAAPLGGALLGNLLSLLLGLWSLRSFLDLARLSGLAQRHRLAGVIAVHPMFIIAATSSHDFIWALAFVMATASAQLQGRVLWAGLWGALAMAARLQTAPLILGLILLGFLDTDGRRSRRLAGLSIAGLLAGTAYLLPAAHAGWSLDFLRVGMGEPQLWTPWLRLGKAAYKSLYFWGLPASILIAGLLLRSLIIGRDRWRDALSHKGIHQALLVIVVTKMIFWAFPIEKTYLLPILPFALLLLAKTCVPGRRWLLVLILAVFSQSLLTLNVARPNRPHAATAAAPGLWLEKGDLLRDVQRRLRLRDVDTMEAYVDTLRAHRRREGLPPSRELEALAEPYRRSE